jgi:hypothetical protein
MHKVFEGIKKRISYYITVSSCDGRTIWGLS